MLMAKTSTPLPTRTSVQTDDSLASKVVAVAYGAPSYVVPQYDRKSGVYTNTRTSPSDSYRTNVNYLHGHRLEDGSLYTGEASQDDTPNGRGTFRFSNGDTYAGEVHNGKPDGYGTRNYVLSGERYEGEFRGGKRHGAGILYNSYGWGDRGIWRDDFMVQ